LDESGKIIGIVGGILAIIVSVWGGIFRFVPWLRRRVDAFKSKLIQEAVIQADSQCQIALCDLREMIQKGMKSMRTCAGTAKEQEQLAAAMKETLLSLQRALALVVMGMAGRRPAGTPKEQEQLAAEKREEVRSFMASQ
jgi:hypothetical protein